MSSSSSTLLDVLIVGGGPAGAAAGSLLAEYGYSVAIIEKDHFPRYHVGESMIPYCYFPLERIGMIEKMQSSDFVRKYSVQFASPSGRISQPFYFEEHFDHPATTTWQVDRSEFDQLILEHAEEKGAKVFHGWKADQILDADGTCRGIVAKQPDGQPQKMMAKLVIDASGRNGFTATRKGWRRHDANLRKISIWTYYKGAVRDPGKDEGATTIAYLPEKGWFWYIPLKNDTVSVGIVAEKDYLYRDGKDLDAIFEREAENNLWIKQHLETGTPAEPLKVTADYTYRSQYSAMNGLVLTGDAFSFIDPVFSSGLYLALLGGEYVADAAHEALQSGDVTAERFSEYAARYCGAIEAMRKLVYAFYHPEFNFRSFFEKHPGMHHDVTDCLIGNLDRDYTELFTAIGEFVELPEALTYGQPYLNR